MKSVILFVITAAFFSCNNFPEDQHYYDGRLEADIIKVTAKVSGSLDSVLFDEGDLVKKGDLLALVDSERLLLQKKQREAQAKEIESQLLSFDAQEKQLKAELKLNMDMIAKTKKLLKEGAVVSQRLDELETQNEVMRARFDALNAGRAVLKDKHEQINAAIALSELNIMDCRLTAPINGTILNRYFNESELVNPGLPLLEIANLAEMEVSFYVSLTKLPAIKIGQQQTVLVDGIEKPFKGTVKWISSEAEFTPKTILTEETRTSLVYAVKIRVDNPDGSLKIGMPVRISTDQK